MVSRLLKDITCNNDSLFHLHCKCLLVVSCSFDIVVIKINDNEIEFQAVKRKGNINNKMTIMVKKTIYITIVSNLSKGIVLSHFDDHLLICRSLSTHWSIQYHEISSVIKYVIGKKKDSLLICSF